MLRQFHLSVFFAEQRLCEHMRGKEYVEGEVIIQDGHLSYSIFLIAEGKARVTKKSTDDSEVMLCTVGPGDLVGEMALLTHAPRSAAVTTLTASYFY